MKNGETNISENSQGRLAGCNVSAPPERPPLKCVLVRWYAGASLTTDAFLFHFYFLPLDKRRAAGQAGDCVLCMCALIHFVSAEHFRCIGKALHSGLSNPTTRVLARDVYCRL